MKQKLTKLNEVIKTKTSRVKELKQKGNEKAAYRMFLELEEALKEKALINKFNKI